MPCTMWMKTIQQVMKSNNLSPNEVSDVAQNRPLRLETAVYIWGYALLAVLARNKKTNISGRHR